MYIRSLRLENMKLLADQDFSFVGADGTPRMWTVLLGDNGVCKTSILQSIAIATSGDKMTRALVPDAADYVDVRDPDRGVRIGAELEDESGRRLGIQMWVAPSSHAFAGNEAAAELDRVRDRREPGWFVAGYGVGRRLPRKGEVPAPRDPARDRLASLFDAQQLVLGVDFFEVLRERGLHLDYVRALQQVLLAKDVDNNGLLPFLDDLELRGKAGVDTMTKLLESRRIVVNVGGGKLRLAPHQLSQGYQSTFAWIADLLGHAFLDQGSVAPADLRGIVLLDEIDLHLHPTWQRRIVPILRALFPKLQFVVTTHSPLVITGFQADEIVRVDLVDGQVVQIPVALEPGLQTGTELMQTYFDVPVAARPELVERQQEYAALLGKPQRNATEDSRLAVLRAELEPYLRSTELADLPAPEAIPDDADPGDRENWRRQLLAQKGRPFPEDEP